MTHATAELPARLDDDLSARLDPRKLALAVQAVISKEQITNAQAARELRLPPPRVSEILRGDIMPSAATLFAVLSWLHMDAAEFTRDPAA